MNKKAKQLLFLMICIILSSCSTNKMWVTNRSNHGGEISYKGQFNMAKAEQLVPCSNFRFKDHKMAQNFIPHRHIPVYRSAIKDEPKKDSHVHYIRHNKEDFWLQNTVGGSIKYECYTPRYLHRKDDYYNAYNERYEKIKYLDEKVKSK